MPWEKVARRQAGVIGRGQLHDAGLSAAAVTRLCRSGTLQRLRRGVFVAAAAPMSYEAGLWAAVLETHGTLGFATAAHLWGFTDVAGDAIDVIIPVGSGHQPRPGLRLHRVQVSAGVRELRHGLPVTSRVCTLLDHLGRLRPDDALELADRALGRSWLKRRDVELRLQRNPGRSGNRQLRQILQITGDGAAARSERLMHRLLYRAGLTGWIANHEVWVDGELVAVVDVAFVEVRIAIEVDGMAFHIDPDRFQRDRSRQNHLVGLGWTVLRFTWADLTNRPGYVIRTVLGSCARPASTSSQNRGRS